MRDSITTLASELREAHDLFGIAKVMCVVGRASFGVHQVAIYLVGAGERPLLSFDNAPRVDDATRLHYLAAGWVHDPFHRALREHHAPIGYEGDHIHTLALPLLDPSGMLGAIYCGLLVPFTAELRSALSIATTYVAVRLAQLQVTLRPRAPTAASLTCRQLEIARLAARGHTNTEISAALEISENTVKKHLKDVYDRLGIERRTQLATLFARASPRDDFPPGVSRREGLVITRVVD